MATFKVGQRVRIVGAHTAEAMRAIGHEGIIVFGMFAANWWGVRVDGVPNPNPGNDGCYGFEGFQLVPLTDPGCERFLESIRKMASKPATLAEILHAKLEA